MERYSATGVVNSGRPSGPVPPSTRTIRIPAPHYHSGALSSGNSGRPARRCRALVPRRRGLDVGYAVGAIWLMARMLAHVRDEDVSQAPVPSRLLVDADMEGDAMKVFVAGATGALGTQLVPQLVAGGHEVVGMTRTASKRAALRALGARPVVADALDPDAVARAVAEAEPEVIVHQATGAVGSAGPATPRPLLRADQPSAHRGHRPPAGRRPRGGSAPLCGAKLRGLAVRAHGRAGQERDRSVGSRPTAGAALHGRGDPLSGAGGDRDPVGRGPGAALRRLLRPGHWDEPGSGRGDGQAGPQATVPAGWGRWRRVVVRPHRGRRLGDRGGRGARPGRDLPDRG